MSIHTYFLELNALERIERCPGTFVYERHNVAAHSFKVTQYAEFFGELEESSGKTIHWKKLYKKALNHDVPEFIVSDIPTPVKYATPEMRQMVAQVEELLVSRFIESEIPLPFQASFQEKMGEAKDDTIEGRILAFADKLDQVYEAYTEMLNGNKSTCFPDMFREGIAHILNIDLNASVHYVRNVILPEMMSAHVDVVSIPTLVEWAIDKAKALAD